MLCPPKPKESLTAAVRVARRGSWRTMSKAWTAASSSGSSRLAVAGTICSRSARIVNTDSSAPAAPSRWPVWLFVALTSGCSPIAPRMAAASAVSPTGVDVACAFTWPMSAAVRAASRMAAEVAGAAGALPLGVRGDEVVAVGGRAGPGQPGVHAGAAGPGRVAALEHQRCRPLAQHEAVAGLVERPGGALGLVVAGRHRPHRGEPGHRQWVHAGLGPTHQDDVGAVEPQQVQAPADRLGAGGTGADRRVHAALGPDG